MNIEPLLHLLAEEPETPVDVAEVNLLLALDEYPALDVHAHLDTVTAYAAKVKRRLQGDVELQVLELCQFLFGEIGFTGNRDDYYDPRNSYLNEVLDRKLGIPISLAALAISVGQRAGMNVAGVALPGHFIAVAHGEGQSVYFDPFDDGRIIDASECEGLVERTTGKPFTADAASLKAALPGEIVVRMLNNLKGIYLERDDYPRCARIVERLKVLLPGDPNQRRDLGLCQMQTMRYGAALDHLRDYLKMVPNAADAPSIRNVMAKAAGLLAQWN